MRIPAILLIGTGMCLLSLTVAPSTGASPKKGKKPEAPASAPEGPSNSAPSSAPAPSPAAVGGGSSWVRLWKEDFANKNKVRLELVSKTDKAKLVHFEPTATGAFFTDYANIPAGAATLLLTLPGSESDKDASIPVTLLPDSFTTILVHDRDGKPEVEILNDAPASVDEKNAEFTVRNFAFDLAEIRVQAGDTLNARLRAPSCYLNAHGFPREKLQIDTTTKSNAGKESHWATEIDFSTSRKATLLIFVDPYGRVRPRVVFDGQPATTKSEVAREGPSPGGNAPTEAR